MNDLFKPKNNPLEVGELAEVDFEKYKSPLEMVFGGIDYSAIGAAVDNAVVEAVARVGVDVDKEELMRALTYDKDQYAQGYKAGREAALAYTQQLEENQALCEELAESSLKLLDLAVDTLVSFEHDCPCDEMGGSDYCENHCKFKCPQRECWIRYFIEQLGWLDRIPLPTEGAE